MRKFAVFILLMFLLLLAVTTASAAGPTVRVEPPPGPVAPGSEFTTNVLIENAKDVTAFQFDLTYDPDVLEIKDMKLGPFLGSSGRAPQPLGPRLEPGRGVVGGFTLGADKPGASGDGVLVIVTWKAKAAGTSQVSLSRLQVAGTLGSEIQSQVGEPIEIVVATGAGGETPAGEQPAPFLGGSGLLVIVAVAVLIVIALVVILRRAR